MKNRYFMIILKYIMLKLNSNVTTKFVFKFYYTTITKTNPHHTIYNRTNSRNKNDNMQFKYSLCVTHVTPPWDKRVIEVKHQSSRCNMYIILSMKINNIFTSRCLQALLLKSKELLIYGKNPWLPPYLQKLAQCYYQ